MTNRVLTSAPSFSEHGDAIIIGASSTKHIDQNLVDLEKGPLPDEVLEALEKAWEIAKPKANN
jgi:aflatoxin B1 aldehyde reductase